MNDPEAVDDLITDLPDQLIPVGDSRTLHRLTGDAKNERGNLIADQHLGQVNFRV